MDLTQLFKASVKTVRLRNKSGLDKNRILKIKTRDDFFLKANDVRYQVSQLHDLLLENRAAYMRFGYHLKASTQMTDSERDIIDMESEKIITICNQYINDLKAACVHSNTKQLMYHKTAILDILSEYLKDVLRMHSKQRRCRIQHEKDSLKFLKLESNRKRNGQNAKKNTESSTVDSTNKRSTSKDQIKVANTSKSEIAIDEDQVSKFGGEEENFTTDDVQLFESENMQLMNDLKGLTDEVEQIERSVVGIARLQEIFTEKVNIMHIHKKAYMVIAELCPL